MAVITFRATDEEKARWIAAAGGERKLSRYIRARLNGEAGDPGVGHGGTESPQAEPPASPVKTDFKKGRK